MMIGLRQSIVCLYMQTSIKLMFVWRLGSVGNWHVLLGILLKILALFNILNKAHFVFPLNKAHFVVSFHLYSIENRLLYSWCPDAQLTQHIRVLVFFVTECDNLINNISLVFIRSTKNYPRPTLSTEKQEEEVCIRGPVVGPYSSFSWWDISNIRPLHLSWHTTFL